MIGINLSGAEFGNAGGRYGWDYIYPSASELTYYADRGVELVRLPVKWERLQPTAGGAIDAEELGHLKQFLADAQAEGIKVIVDLHNFGFYYNNQLGTPGITDAQFADFWKKLATAIGDQPALAGYDLMNEPHDMAAGAWNSAAQAAVNAIRQVDTTHQIYVEGESWANAVNWSVINANLNVKDPADKLVYEAHLYFDKWQSGTYQGTYEQEEAYPNVGVDRLQDFVAWLADHNAKGFVGEFAVPNNDPRWLDVLDRFLTALDKAGLDGTYWGGGAWWGNYPMALRNADGAANPQLGILEHHIALDHASGGQQAPSLTINHIVGTDAGEYLTGTASADWIEGGAGHDRLTGGDADDKL
ncbi:MAG: glycoside hydrolase family 5 protein, partial [Hyphomicrobiales bacterium]